MAAFQDNVEHWRAGWNDQKRELGGFRVTMAVFLAPEVDED